jgi:hypothetical protein
MNKNLVGNIIKFMTVVGNHNKMTGEEKKKWVLLKLKEEMTYDENLENIIIEMIDYLVLVDNNTIKINPIVKYCCLNW